MDIRNKINEISYNKKCLVVLIIFVIVILSIGYAFSSNVQHNQTPEEQIEQLDYKAMYRANLDKITKVKNELEDVQDNNYFYEIQNKEITSLHILKYGYEELNNRDFTNDPYPRWINKMYYDKYKSLQNIKKAVKSMKENNDTLLSNYHRLVNHGHENLDDHIAIDSSHHVRVNDFRLINK